jgi:hypothetical protein
VNPCKVEPKLKIPGHISGIVISAKQTTTRSSGWEALKLKLQAGLLAHGSSPPSAFPDVYTQWSLEALPIYSGPTAQDLNLNSLFSPSISRGTWSLFHIQLFNLTLNLSYATLNLPMAKARGF